MEAISASLSRRASFPKAGGDAGDGTEKREQVEEG